MREPIKIVVILEAGMVQDILISSGQGEAYIIDYDVEGLAPDELMTVSFAGSTEQDEEALVEEKAFVTHWDNIFPDPKFVDRLAKDFAAHQKKSIREEKVYKGKADQGREAQIGAKF